MNWKYLYGLVGLLWLAGLTLVVLLLTACASKPPLACPSGLSENEGYCCVVQSEMRTSDTTAETGEVAIISLTAACIDNTGKKMEADLLQNNLAARLGVRR